MSESLATAALFVPLLLIFWIANVAEARRSRGEPYQGVAIVAVLALAAMFVAGLLAGLLMQVAAVAMQSDPEAFAQVTGPIEFASLDLFALGLWGPSLLGLLLLLPVARRAVGRFTALDADNPVHGVSLALTMLVFINLMITLGIGLDNLADMMASAQSMQGDVVESRDPTLSIWVQQLLTALLAMVGVGWLSRRDWGATLARLGIERMDGRQWLVGVGAGVGMVPVVVLLEAVLSQFGWGAQADVGRLTEMLIGGLFETPFGILTLGLAAALGEEAIFRGAMQPRFGLWLTSILFALVHSNYGITFSTLIVLLLGLLLGWLRIRYNTTTAMVTHAVYNMSLGLLAYLGVSLME